MGSPRGSDAQRGDGVIDPQVMDDDEPDDHEPDDHEMVDDEMVDEAERESYPASDPPSFWAGPDEPPIDEGPASDPERRS